MSPAWNVGESWGAAGPSVRPGRGAVFLLFWCLCVGDLRVCWCLHVLGRRSVGGGRLWSRGHILEWCFLFRDAALGGTVVGLAGSGSFTYMALRVLLPKTMHKTLPPFYMAEGGCGVRVVLVCGA